MKHGLILQSAPIVISFFTPCHVPWFWYEERTAVFSHTRPQPKRIWAPEMKSTQTWRWSHGRATHRIISSWSLNEYAINASWMEALNRTVALHVCASQQLRPSFYWAERREANSGNGDIFRFLPRLPPPPPPPPEVVNTCASSPFAIFSRSSPCDIVWLIIFRRLNYKNKLFQ